MYQGWRSTHQTLVAPFDSEAVCHLYPRSSIEEQPPVERKVAGAGPVVGATFSVAYVVKPLPVKETKRVQVSPGNPFSINNSMCVVIVS